MSFNKDTIKNELKKHIPSDWEVDLDEVIDNVEIVDGFYVFTVKGDGFAFINNTLIDVMPGWKYTTEMNR